MQRRSNPMLKSYQLQENNSITEGYQEVATLFREHPDLLVEFTHFLPDASGAASLSYAPSSRNSIFRRDDKSLPLSSTRHIHVEKNPIVSHADRDLSVNRLDLDHDKALLRASKEHRRCGLLSTRKSFTVVRCVALKYFPLNRFLYVS